MSNLQNSRLEKLVTIIVPVFNIEKYLERCVESLINQKYSNLEIILVDDGSTDQSAAICDHYMNRDSRVTVIHKVNGGLSDARNAALEVAKGDYISLVDGDDYVSKYYISNLVTALEVANAEMSMSWFENVIEDRIPSNTPSEVNESEIEVMNAHDCVKRLLYQDYVETSACGKLYKKDLFYNLKYPVGKLYEDILVTYETIRRSQKIALIKNVDYYYFQRRNSIQYQKFTINKLDAVKHIKMLELNVSKDYPDLTTAAACRVFSVVSNIYFQVDNSNEYQDIKKQLWALIKQYRKIILKDASARKKARAGAFLSYLGPSLMSKIYHATQFRG